VPRVRRVRLYDQDVVAHRHIGDASAVVAGIGVRGDAVFPIGGDVRWHVAI
jgi:hypothetical protein